MLKFLAIFSTKNNFSNKYPRFKDRGWKLNTIIKFGDTKPINKLQKLLNKLNITRN